MGNGPCAAGEHALAPCCAGLGVVDRAGAEDFLPSLAVRPLRPVELGSQSMLRAPAAPQATSWSHERERRREVRSALGPELHRVLAEQGERESPRDWGVSPGAQPGSPASRAEGPPAQLRQYLAVRREQVEWLRAESEAWHRVARSHQAEREAADRRGPEDVRRSSLRGRVAWRSADSSEDADSADALSEESVDRSRRTGKRSL